MWTSFWLGILIRDYFFFPLLTAEAKAANPLYCLSWEGVEFNHVGVTFYKSLLYAVVFVSRPQTQSVKNEVLDYQELAHVLKEEVTFEYRFISVDLGF